MNKSASTLALSSRKARVSLAMIVRDEEQNLPLCLESSRGLFNEIVIVDTGSVDRTKKIALEFGARVIDFTWINDFAAARNVSLENATGDYIFWLDADDVIDPPQKEKLETLFDGLPLEHKSAHVMRCICDPASDGSGQIAVDHIRLFPLLKRVRWVYRVHEQILPALNHSNVKICWSDIIVRHTGYTDKNIREAKRLRDYNILVDELSKHPNDAFILFNLGMITFERKQWQKALDYFCFGLSNLSKSSAMDSLMRKIFAMIAWTHQILGNYSESLHISDKGLSIYPEDAELWFRKAVAHRYRHEGKEAEMSWRRILSLQPPQQFSSIDHGIYGHLTRRNLAILAEEHGDYAESEAQWRAVLAECPDDADAMRHIIILTSKMKSSA